MENLRNIVILKNLPSNLIEEAFIVLKKNQRVKNLEHVDTYKNFISDREGDNDNDFIIKEAELLIDNYINNNSEDFCTSQNNKINKKYKRLRKLVALLSCCLFLAVIYILL